MIHRDCFLKENSGIFSNQAQFIHPFFYKMSQNLLLKNDSVCKDHLARRGYNKMANAVALYNLIATERIYYMHIHTGVILESMRTGNTA